MTRLRIGSSMPSFALTSHAGEVVRNEALLGKGPLASRMRHVKSRLLYGRQMHRRAVKIRSAHRGRVKLCPRVRQGTRSLRRKPQPKPPAWGISPFSFSSFPPYLAAWHSDPEVQETRSSPWASFGLHDTAPEHRVGPHSALPAGTTGAGYSIRGPHLDFRAQHG